MSVATTDHWVTNIAEVLPDEVVIRGRRLTDLLGTVSYTEMMYFILTGNLPTKPQAHVLDALLISVMDHGISPTSTVTRMLGSYGVPIQAAIAGGVLAFGDTQGGAGEQLAKLLSDSVDADAEGDLELLAERIVTQARANGIAIPGFGHPQHGVDPRAPILLGIARDAGVYDKHCELIERIGRVLSERIGRSISLNIDGVSAGIQLDLGIRWEYSRLLMIAPRVVGLAAHYVEEREQGNLWRHVPADAVEYTGVQPS